MLTSSAKKMKLPLLWRFKRRGIKSRKKPASNGTPTLVDNPETVEVLLGAVVWMASVELKLPPEMVAGEKAQVVFAGD
jgi:hypothetical protein